MGWFHQIYNIINIKNLVNKLADGRAALWPRPAMNARLTQTTLTTRLRPLCCERRTSITCTLMAVFENSWHFITNFARRYWSLSKHEKEKKKLAQIGAAYPTWRFNVGQVVTNALTFTGKILKWLHRMWDDSYKWRWTCVWFQSVIVRNSFIVQLGMNFTTLKWRKSHLKCWKSIIYKNIRICYTLLVKLLISLKMKKKIDQFMNDVKARKSNAVFWM